MSFWRMPLDAAAHCIIVGKVNIIAYRCKGCKYCIEFCPNGVLAESKDFNEKGYHPPFVKTDGKCINCNFCETICPEFAIFVTEKERKPLNAEDVIRDAGVRGRRRKACEK
jgi:2-oxoglutarate ferredoxin oxidoreductase subunit delta